MQAFDKLWLRQSGFAEVPTFWPAQVDDILYRVYGEERYKLGSCFSLDEPTNVSSAELNSNIVKWGNRCLYVATFKVRRIIPMWIGRIDQRFGHAGDPAEVFVGGNPHAVQAWMERTYATLHNLELVGTRRLIQDKTVILPHNPHQSN